MFPLFSAGINGTSSIGGKFAVGVVDLELQILYLRKFSKKIEMTLLLLSEAWEKMIREKIRKCHNKIEYFGFV